MPTSRLEAFSDGVLAIIITITVLGIRVPEAATREALMAALPMLGIYAWSFQTVGTYWNNHHHLLKATRRISAGVMWANLHLLFWLSLIPLTTEWLGRHFGATWPTAAYAAVLFMAAVAYNLLEQAIIVGQGRDPVLASALGHRAKEAISLAFYLAAVPAAFLAPWTSYVLIFLVTAMWLLPDGRIRIQPDARIEP